MAGRPKGSVHAFGTSAYGVQVRHMGGTWMFPTSDKARRSLRNAEVVAAQVRRDLERAELLVTKMRAAVAEMDRREEAGLAKQRPRRRPAAGAEG